jgi:predicted transposase/invertase (TIGR01784 family)
MSFINPKTDFAFKKIFGSAESKDILISFLNALIYNAEPTIEDLEIIDPYLPPSIQGLKDSYLDVKARLKDGSLVIIEMQVLNVDSFSKRILYNAAKTYSLQLQAGEGYRFLKPVIALTLTDFVMFPESEELISRFIFKEKSKNFSYLENEFSLIFIELPKFHKMLEELETLTEKWIYFMQTARTLDSIPAPLIGIPEFQKAFQIADRANLSRKDLEDLEKREMFIYDQQGVILYAQNEGRQQGIQEGRQEGWQEAQLEIARQSLDLLDDDTIARITQLPMEAVRNLRQQRE